MQKKNRILQRIFSSSKKEELFSKKFLFSALSVSLFLSAISLFVFPGYQTEREDQVFYVAPLLQKADPSLLQNDFLMQTTQTTASFFDEFFGFFLFQDPENITEVLFWGAFASRVLFFLGIALLALAISKNTIFALGIPLVFLVGHAGSVCNALPSEYWMSSFGMELHARSAALPLALLALGIFFGGKKGIAFFVASLAFLLHPISAIPLLAFFGIETIISFFQEKNFRNFLPFLFPIFALAILVITMGGESGMSLFTLVDAEWANILRDRTPWLFSEGFFFGDKKWGSVLGPLFLLFFLLLQNHSLEKNIRQKSIIFFATTFLLCLSALVFFDVFLLAIFGQLQLYRALFFLQIVLVIGTMATFLTHFLKSSKKIFKILFLLGFLAIPFGGSLFAIPLSILLLTVIFWINPAPKIAKTAVGIFSAILLFLCLNHPNIMAQFQNLWNFVASGDTLLSIGLFLEWTKKIFWVFALFLILVIFHGKRLSDRFFSLIIGGGIGGMILVFVIFWGDFQKIISQEWADKSEEMTQWILENTEKDALFFASETTEEICTFWRNHHGRNCFVSHTEGGQTAFSRDGSREWRDRRLFQKNPKTYLPELQKRGVDFLIFKKEEDFPGTPLFEDEKLKIFAIEKKEDL